MTGDVCSVCGLSSDLCMCSTIAKEKQVVTISVVKRRFGKPMTIVAGIDQKSVDIKAIAKQLKTKLACGGTVKNGNIEIQGNQKQAAKKVLIKAGFAEESIEVV
jgi:translation initiation factor 1